jgi:glycosyltransferase involved in cell wall biosynthesis
MSRRSQIGEKILFIGNDIHEPINEMAAKLADHAGQEFQVPYAKVISIQSRKPVLPGESRRVLPLGRGGRIGQILRLRKWLRHDIDPAIRLIHFWGDGKKPLNRWLIYEARRSGRSIVFSPTGPAPFQKNLPPCAHIIFPHPEAKQAFLHPIHPPPDRHFVIRPLTCPTAPSLRTSGHAKGILFASVPPKAKEFAGRGIPLLIEGMQLLSREGINAELTILNRHPGVAEALFACLPPESTAKIRIETRQVENMQAYMRNFGFIAAPFLSGKSPLVPLSILEGMAVGCPALVSSKIPLADEVVTRRAGMVIDNPEAFARAYLALRTDYADYAKQALKLIGELYGPEQFFNGLERAYDQILEST